MSSPHDVAASTATARQAALYRRARSGFLSWRMLVLVSVAVCIGTTAAGLAVESAVAPDATIHLGAVAGIVVGLAMTVALFVSVEPKRAALRRVVERDLARWAAGRGLEPLRGQPAFLGAPVWPLDQAPSGSRCEGWRGVHREASVEAYHLEFRGGATATYDPRGYTVWSATTWPVPTAVEVFSRGGGEPGPTPPGLTIDSPEFRARWKVVAEIDEHARAVLSPHVVRRLMESDAVGAHVAWQGHGVHVTAPGREGRVALWQARLDLVADLARLTPQGLTDWAWGPIVGPQMAAASMPAPRTGAATAADLVPVLAQWATVFPPTMAVAALFFVLSPVAGILAAAVTMVTTFVASYAVGRVVRRRMLARQTMKRAAALQRG